MAVWLAAGLAATAMRVGAQDLTVVKPRSDRSILDVSQFAVGTDEYARRFFQTLGGDLGRSGWFEIVGGGGDLRLIGSCEERRGDVQVQCQVVQVGAGRTFLSRKYADTREKARRLAHRVADDIVQAVTGSPGIAATRIAMIGTRDGHKEVYVCDADGENIQRVTWEKSICVGPNWGPDGAKLVFTSFRSYFPDLYVADLQAGTRVCLANYPGLNTTADISPDGRQVALTLSKDGNPDLYVRELAGDRRLRRLTKNTQAGVASPSWSPDGQQIVFVSDRSGSPQLYLIAAGGGQVDRLTSRGTENVAPDWGPMGWIAFTSRRDGAYHLCIIDPKTRVEHQLTSDHVDHEDPSWAPDGRHIVFTRTERHQAALYVLDIKGGASIRLTPVAGNWYSPAWSPK